MRSILISLLTIVLLVGGFFAYFSLQKGSRRSAQAPAPTRFEPAPVPPAGGGQVIGPGEDVWVITPDEKTGKVAFQFRASRYDPQPDGDVRVERPQAEVFLGDERRQVVRIEGATGRVVMDSDLTQRGPVRGRDAGAPRRGTLNDVTISLFDEADRSRALLVCRVNNIAFDNDTFRIATEAFNDGGREVSGDDVPVEVRGEEFDFDGRGLTIRWNEADRRLQMLEIAHGESLTIKSPQMLEALDRGFGDSEGARPTPPAPDAKDRATTAPRPEQPAAAGEPRREPPADVQSEPSQRLAPVYRASFSENVRVMQAQSAIASADQMLIDFLGSSADPVVKPAESTPRDTSDAKSKPRTGDASPPLTSSPISAAPRPDPIVVRWAGKLRITALEGESPRPAPESFNIAMSSEHAPVLLDHQGLKVTCATFDYRSGEDLLTVTSSKLVPMIHLAMDDGTTVQTPSIVYEGADSRATLRGAGSAQIRVQNAPQRAVEGAAPKAHQGATDELPNPDNLEPKMLTASWQEACELSLLRGRDRRVALERAVLKGKVDVEHSRLALQSDALELSLAAGATESRPTLKELSAEGSVECTLIDAEGAHSDIRCDHLSATVVTLADGQMALRTVTAEGNVLAKGDESQLSAGHLTFTVAPARPVDADAKSDAGAATRPASAVLAGGDFELEQLRAQQQVKIQLRDGGWATAQQLDMQREPEGAVFKLLGQPLATLSDGTNTLSGANIRIAYDAQQLRVNGPGTLDFDARESPDQPARPVQVAWRAGLSVDGPKDDAEITGTVTIESTAADGSKQLAAGERVQITLSDAPRPAAASVEGSKQPPVEQGDRLTMMQGKTLRTIAIIGDAQVQSVLQGAEASQVRRLHLLAPEVRYDVAHQRAEVPQPGRMLVQDTRPAEQTESPDSTRFGDFRGATAFQWEERLVFDGAENQITMSGSVQIVHQPESDAARTFRLYASRVVAEMLSDSAPATQPASGAEAALFGPSQIELKSVLAEGEVTFTLSQTQIHGHTVEYDATKSVVTARGDERTPVQVFNEQGVSRGSFQEVVYDLNTEHMQMREVRAQVRR